jgi:GNAT superfamily N-acetyltransferase
MHKEITIRRAVPEDAAALVEFNQAMAQETEGKLLDPQVLQSGVESVFHNREHGFYVVAESAGRIAGGLLVTFEWSDWRDSWFWWIQSVYVRPEFRGHRVYSMLHHFVEGLARQQGDVCGIRLYVEKENLHAQRVYEKMGMTQSRYLMYEETL